MGIIKLPLDGNPNNTMGLIAHPGTIRDIAATSDGKYFFTCGGENRDKGDKSSKGKEYLSDFTDYSVNIWYVDVGVLEKNFFRKSKLKKENLP